MKKLFMILPLVILFCFLFGCEKQEQIERFMEDGVEVIFNHVEPNKLRGEPSALILEEEFTFDTEKDEIAETGLIDIGGFNIDSEGNIYIFSDRRDDESLFYKFDQNGILIKAFGKRGQGPGEINRAWYMYLTAKDKIPICSDSPHKLVIFDEEGAIIQETPLEWEENFSGFEFFPLENGNYLKHGQCLELSTLHVYDVLQLFNSNFEAIKEFDRCDYGISSSPTMREEITPRVFIWQILDELIYVGHEKRGYEILVYDWDGNLLKKIRKEYTPADVPDEMKEVYSSYLRPSMKDKYVLLDKMPPFHCFFLDDEGRLYVMTFEKGLNKDEYFHDIFSSDGVFILRKSMPGYARWRYPGNSVNRAKVKNRRFYCIREKESGFKELVVYKMRWE